MPENERANKNEGLVGASAGYKLSWNSLGFQSGVSYQIKNRGTHSHV